MKPVHLDRHGQSIVEFALTVGLLMVLVIATAQLAIYLHYRNGLALACKEGAFQAALAGHSLSDGEQATQDMWQKVEPSGGAIRISGNEGTLVSFSVRTSAPAILPIPVMPLGKLPVTAQCSHTIERFQPGSS